MRELSVIFWMWQAQEKKNEREERRKGLEPLRKSPWAYSEELYDCHQILMGRYPIHNRNDIHKVGAQ